ncbi:hypothetical protein U8607_19590 [Methylobacterium durans]|uniref:hypothetical protein n=1 Tax=Methylobacterium durans TaxID=2202825 RepID=UPI002B001ED7|nr:hypothetical protein [Methylobacterium durans]MEA1834301.1 hypothetical protein [Methylobacterium durans]
MRITMRQYLRACSMIVVALFAMAAASLVGRAYHPTEAVAEQVQSGGPMPSTSPVRSRRLRSDLAGCRADLLAAKVSTRDR